MMSRIFLIMLVIFSLAPVLARAQGAAQALADKSDQLIVFYDETGAPIARFQAAFGRGHGPKIREGDMRTPEGDYWLMPARVSDDWHYFLAIDYPNANDLVRARRAGLPMDQLGGRIGLHGTGDGFVHKLRQNFGENWTLGCIAVDNAAIQKAREMVTHPIPIRIQP